MTFSQDIAPFRASVGPVAIEAPTTRASGRSDAESAALGLVRRPVGRSDHQGLGPVGRAGCRFKDDTHKSRRR